MKGFWGQPLGQICYASEEPNWLFTLIILIIIAHHSLPGRYILYQKLVELKMLDCSDHTST